MPFHSLKAIRITYLSPKTVQNNSFMPYFVNKFKKRIKENKKVLSYEPKQAIIYTYQPRHMSRITNMELNYYEHTNCYLLYTVWSFHF